MNKEKRGEQPIKERRIITNPDVINTTPINTTMNPEARCTTPRNVNESNNVDAICAQTKTERELANIH